MLRKFTRRYPNRQGILLIYKYKVMRIYENCYELMSEIMREVWEMGKIVHPHSMQNKKVKDDENFRTKEIINYSYCLKTLDQVDELFRFSPESRGWVNAELNERVNQEKLNPGQAWKIRLETWQPFLNNLGMFDYTYSERIGNSLERIISELSTNPDSRQCILSIWDRVIDIRFLGGVKRVPCSVYYQFLLRDGKLNIIYNQRSADVVTHFGNDVWLAYNLGAWAAEQINVPMGDLFHNITSLHCYAKDWETLKKGIS